MIKKSGQKLKANKNEITQKNNNKSNNSSVGVAYHATPNAITLIALVLSIIVLLILAGVTILLVLEPEGLLKQAQDATDIYKEEEKDEVNSISNVVSELDKINDKVDKEPTYDMVDGVPVPKGFIHIEGTKDTGFVIRNNVDSNEFVWIPVKDMPYTYNRYAFVGGSINNVTDGIDTTTNSTKIKMSSSASDYYTEAIQTDEQTSVSTYGGYYIARYEAGILTKRTSNTTPTEKPIFKKSTNEQKVYGYNYVTRDQAKSLSEGLYNKIENNVTSKLCSSYAWDTALKFIETKNSGWATNSIGGNYFDLKIGYQPTGYHSINNIYDMGGNYSEWTSETSSKTKYPAVYRRRLC